VNWTLTFDDLDFDLVTYFLIFQCAVLEFGPWLHLCKKNLTLTLMTYIWTPSLTLLFIKLLPWNLEFSYKFARWIKHWNFADLHFERVTYFLYLSYCFFYFHCSCNLYFGIKLDLKWPTFWQVPLLTQLLRYWLKTY